MVDCTGKSTWIIVLAVYSGVLTGGLVGYLVYKFVKSRVSTFTLLYFFLWLYYYVTGLTVGGFYYCVTSYILGLLSPDHPSTLIIITRSFFHKAYVKVKNFNYNFSYQKISLNLQNLTNKMVFQIQVSQ